MKLIIDTDAKTVTREESGEKKVCELYSPEAFALISREWVRVGWAERYSYTFSWMGRPIIQLPEDMVRTQEVVHRVRPDVIVETGVARGGSLIYYASLCRMFGKGRVVGVDIEIRPDNRRAIEAHPMFDLITLVEGSSTDPDVVRHVHELVKPGETVLVILDSDHRRQHVADELAAYHDMVTPGSYIVATDGIMCDLHDVPGGDARWKEDHPSAAAREFAAGHPEFTIEQPAWPFSESEVDQGITYWPDAWLRRKAE